MLNITGDTFELEVLQSDIPVLVDFWADWCGPCKMLAPVLEGLESKYEGKVMFCKVNIDDDGPLAITHRVMSIPTMIVFKDGNALERLVGARPESEIAEFLDSLVG